MDPSFLVVQALNGLASGSALFLTSVGLTIIFGVTRIVNFAHGSFYMLGAYLAIALARSLMGWLPGPLGFWAAILIAALLVGLTGVLIELLLLRRIYEAPELFQLLLTFGLVLVFQDLVKWVWGPEEILGPRAPGLRGAVEILGRRFPQYDLVLIVAGPLALLVLWLVFTRTRFGILVRAATQDREMVDALGVNQKLLFTGVFFLGAALAGLAGALQIPRESAHPFMDLSMIVQAFVVTVIGGMGSVPGSFLAALLIGLLHAFGILIFPKVTIVLVFLVMAVVLVIRPWGLLGRPELLQGARAHPQRPLLPDGVGVKLGYGVVVLLLLAFPLWADAYLLKLMTDIMVFALFAMSLGFLMGTGGIVSFGHAAYFGLGAYGAGLATVRLGLPMEIAILAAPLLAGLGALLFGALCVRLAGVYLAMLTLAFAQIVYAIAFQWLEVTGGDNGLIGIWPSPWAASRQVYYWLALGCCLGGVALLYRATHAPFGFALRAIRDSRARAQAIGIDARRHQWLGFTMAGVMAGIAGGVYAFSNGSIDPSVLAIPMSVDALTMTLLGGVQTVMGPVVGAAALTLLKEQVMPLTDYWRFLLGLVIVILVLLFRQGLVGFIADRLERRALA
jgi:branched-chain amino acid transport system permease protein